MTSLIRSILISMTVAALAAGCRSTPATSADQLATTPVAPMIADTTRTLERVRVRLDQRLVMHLSDPQTGKPLNFPGAPSPAHAAAQPSFKPTSYAAGVIYAGMLSAAQATGDPAFDEFDARRFQFFAQTIPKFTGTRLKLEDNPFQIWLKPGQLDDCGAMGAAFIKARQARVGPDLKILIDRFADFVSHRQYRLADGTIARKRPFTSCLWIDDIYMSVPILAQMGALTGKQSYYDDAARQVIQLSDRLMIPATGLYTHGCDMDAPDQQPTYYWGRANGWAMMAMCELLEVLPEDHPQRAAILKLFRTQVRAVASVQSGTGLWHQMLDRTDSYLETSCSAMFTFAIAHGINRGWLNPNIYGPVAISGWNAVNSRIDSTGRISGTCIGTSYAADDTYYYNRPAADDAHAYGPALMAGAEIIRLYRNPDFVVRVYRKGPILLLEKSQATTTVSPPDATQPDAAQHDATQPDTKPN